MMIRMPRGDFRPVAFLINDPNDTAIEFDPDEIYFTVKKTSKDRLYQFQKRLSKKGIYQVVDDDGHPVHGFYQVEINPEDTNKMKYGDYVFDIQIQYGKLKETFVGQFILTDEVTFAENE